MKTLTTENYTNFIGAKPDAGLEGTVQSTALLSGLDPDKIRKMAPQKRVNLTNELYAQLTSASKPIMMFQYKGKVFAYAPCEVGTLDEMAHATQFIADKNYHLLNHLMFREVKTIHRWAHKHTKWETELGLKVKRFNDFYTDIETYQCKKLKSLDGVDLTFWDDLPIIFTLKAVDFTLGIGGNFAASATTACSPQQMRALQIHQTATIIGSRLHTMSRQMTKLYLPSQACAQFTKYPSYNFLTGGLSSAINKSNKKLLDKPTTDLSVGFVKAAHEIDNNRLPFVVLELLEKVFLGIGTLNKYNWSWQK